MELLTKEEVKRIMIEYNNNLKYMQNNPNLTTDEVNHHYDLVKKRAFILSILFKKFTNKEAIALHLK